MSIFGIDWNGDGDINFMDTAVDAMIINEIENEENDFDDDDDDE